MVQNSPNERNDAQAPAQPDGPQGAAAPGPAASSGARKAFGGRRKLLTRGLAGGSVVLFASTHRALAGGSCDLHTYSGYTSLTTAAKKGKTVGKTTSGGGKAYCGGLTPGYWKTHTSWPGGYKTTNKFSTYFHVPSGVGWTSNTTLLQVLQTTGNAGMVVAPAREFVAAFLNAAVAGGNYPYTPTQVAAIWNANYTNTTVLASYQTYFNTYLDTV